MTKINNSPNIRFKNFSNDWEQRKLKDMTEYKNGKGHEDKQSNSGKYELINLNSISIDGGLKHSGKYIDDATDTLLENDLVMVLSDVGHGDLLGRVALIPENNRFVLNQRVALLRPNDTVNPQFLFSHINAHQQYFKSQGAGMSQLNISKGSVENFTSYVPNLKEQEQIGKLLLYLDKLITLHQRKLEQLQTTKKTFLNKLFPKNKYKTPEIRFDGYSDAWERCKLLDISNILGGFAFKSNEYQPNGKYRVITIANVSGAIYVENMGNRINIRDKSILNKYLLERDDLLVSLTGNVGRISKATGDNEVLNQRVAKISPLYKTSPTFLEAVLRNKKFENSMIIAGQGAAQKNISNNNVLNYKLLVPMQKEQAQIGNVFKEIDNLITLHQRKVELLEMSKKYYLKHMFV